MRAKVLRRLGVVVMTRSCHGAHPLSRRQGRAILVNMTTPIGPREVAAMLGVTRQRLTQLRSDHKDFPAPWVSLGTGAIWRDADVVAWAKAHGRKPEPHGVVESPPWSSA